MITLPAVRFVRCYDPAQGRMVNLWMSITSQDQLRNAPMATECTVTAQNVPGALVEIRKAFSRWLDAETINEIEKASEKLVSAQDSIYEVK